MAEMHSSAKQRAQLILANSTLSAPDRELWAKSLAAGTDEQAALFADAFDGTPEVLERMTSLLKRKIDAIHAGDTEAVQKIIAEEETLLGLSNSQEN